MDKDKALNFNERRDEKTQERKGKILGGKFSGIKSQRTARKLERERILSDPKLIAQKLAEIKVSSRPSYIPQWLKNSVNEDHAMDKPKPLEEVSDGDLSEIKKDPIWKTWLKNKGIGDCFRCGKKDKKLDADVRQNLDAGGQPFHLSDEKGGRFSHEWDAFVCPDCVKRIMSGQDTDEEAKIMRREWGGGRKLTDTERHSDHRPTYLDMSAKHKAWEVWLNKQDEDDIHDEEDEDELDEEDEDQFKDKNYLDDYRRENQRKREQKRNENIHSDFTGDPDKMTPTPEQIERRRIRNEKEAQEAIDSKARHTHRKRKKSWEAWLEKKSKKPIRDTCPGCGKKHKPGDTTWLMGQEDKPDPKERIDMQYDPTHYSNEFTGRTEDIGTDQFGAYCEGCLGPSDPGKMPKKKKAFVEQPDKDPEPTDDIKNNGSSHFHKFVAMYPESDTTRQFNDPDKKRRSGVSEPFFGAGHFSSALWEGRMADARERADDKNIKMLDSMLNRKVDPNKKRGDLDQKTQRLGKTDNITKPIPDSKGGKGSFQHCINSNQDKHNPGGWCKQIERKVEGKKKGRDEGEAEEVKISTYTKLRRIKDRLQSHKKKAKKVPTKEVKLPQTKIDEPKHWWDHSKVGTQGDIDQKTGRPWWEVMTEERERRKKEKEKKKMIIPEHIISLINEKKRKRKEEKEKIGKIVGATRKADKIEEPESDYYMDAGGNPQRKEKGDLKAFKEIAQKVIDIKHEPKTEKQLQEEEKQRQEKINEETKEFPMYKADYFVEEIRANIIYHNKIFPLVGMIAGQVARGVVSSAGKKAGKQLLGDVGEMSQDMMAEEGGEQ